MGTPQRGVPSLGVSLPRALCLVWPLQTYSFKRETFLFQLCKKGGNSLNFHASILPESAVCVCGVDFSFKNRAKVYLVCFDFFSSPPQFDGKIEELVEI